MAVSNEMVFLETKEKYEILFETNNLHIYNQGYTAFKQGDYNLAAEKLEKSIKLTSTQYNSEDALFFAINSYIRFLRERYKLRNWKQGTNASCFLLCAPNLNN